MVLSDDASTNRSDLIASTKCVFNAIQENASDISVSDDYTTNSSDLVASTKCVYNAIQESVIGSGILPGTIVAFSGQFGGEGNRYPIPLTGTEPDTHWCLCDGIETNKLKVPDLRGKMILGSSIEHTVGETGGSETHTHSISGTVGETTLTEAQLASHKHYVSRNKDLNDANENEGPTGYHDTVGNYSSSSWNYTTSSTGSSGTHTHPLAGDPMAGDKFDSASSLPPYYVLSYIMRTA